MKATKENRLSRQQRKTVEKTLHKPDLLFFERQLLEKGYRFICGVDEVGRGPLAGPVTCSAVIMDLEKIVDGVNDSKKVSEKNRKILFPKILDSAIAVCTVSYDNTKIDELNILNATKLCMTEAVLGLKIKPDIVLVDALKLDLPYPTKAIIHGDSLSYSIGAASIVAKVTRDEFMCALAPNYPNFGFETNKGYGTATHIEALKKYGATPLHRASFIKNFV
ncbi:MAG TPA: ribonuclease HII [Clostridia bacterium]|nr:ribonuclease HII [Clostridia bacterium]